MPEPSTQLVSQPEFITSFPPSATKMPPASLSLALPFLIFPVIGPAPTPMGPARSAPLFFMVNVPFTTRTVPLLLASIALPFKSSVTVLPVGTVKELPPQEISLERVTERLLVWFIRVCSSLQLPAVCVAANAVVGTRHSTIQRVSRILSIRFLILHYLRFDMTFCVSR